VIRLAAPSGCHFLCRNDHPPTWVLQAEPGAQTLIDVVESPFLIGRAFDCQLVLPETGENARTTSRWHCHLFEREGVFFLADGSAREVAEMGGRKPSGTGTYRNGRRLREPEPLQPGDVLRVGPWEFRVEARPEQVDIDHLLSRVAQGQTRDLRADDPKVQDGYARLHDLFERIHKAASSEDSLAQILEFASAHIAGAEVAALILEEPGREPQVRIAWQKGVGRILDLQFSSGLLARMSDEAFLLQPRIADPSQSQAEEDIDSGLLVPIRGGAGRLGVLYMDNRGRGEAFSEKDLYLANALAGAASLQLSLERQALLSAVEHNMRRYFGPDVVQMIVDESRAGKRVGLGVRECHATVLFVDMKDFSGFSRKHTPQEIANLLNPYFELMTRCIQAHGGHVDKFIGDAVMGVFGARPVENAPQDDNHASQALRAGLQMLREWTQGQASPWGGEIPLRVGINSGKVVAGNIGSPGRMEYSVLGDTVNLASRIEKLARPNGIAVTEASFEMTRGEFRFLDGGVCEVKGMGPVKLWHLDMDAHASKKEGFRRWEPGQLIEGIYEVKNLLGVGGMGSVYRVRHREWNMDVAVKRPTPQLIAATGGTERFVREAETWVSLPMHPNVVTAYYVRTIGGAPAIFAECVEGGDLLQWLEEGRIQSIPQALDIAVQVCWGMAVAHGKALVHRDLKPANVLMTGGGEPKVTDFGLVKTARQDDVPIGLPQALGHASQMHITRHGAQIGTPAYMPPEQWTGATAGPAADIYAFGVILFELLCGRPPFELGPELEHADRNYRCSEFKRMHAHEPPPDPKSLNFRIPEGLAALLLECLAKPPEKRPQSFLDLAGRLEALYKEVSGEEYARKNPGDLESRSSDLNNRALSMLDLGKKDEAKRLLEDALKADPHHPEASYNLAVLCWGDAQIDDLQAVKRVEEAVKAHPGAGTGEYLLGLLHLRRADALAAEDALARAVRSPAAGPHMLLALGDAKMALGKHAEAEAAYAKALSRTPQSLEARRRMAAALLAQGKKAEAAKAWGGEVPEEALKGLPFPNIACLRALEGHKGYLEALCAAPDGRHAVTGSLDKTLRLWDLSSGECLRVMGGLENTPFAVVTPDGRFALSQGLGGAVAFWDLATGDCAKRLQGLSESVHCLALAPDGRAGVSGSDDGSILRWDFAKGECSLRLEGHSGVVYGVALTPDGKRALSGGGDGALKLWDLEAGACLRTFEGHKQAVVSVLFAAGGRLAVSGSWDDTIRIWDLTSGRCLRVLEGHSTVTSLAAGFERRLLLSGALDKTLRLWELPGGRCLRTLKDLPGSIYAVAFTPDGRRALSAGSDKVLRVWNVPDSLSLPPLAFAHFLRSEEAAKLQQKVLGIRAQVVRETERGRWAQAGLRLQEARAVPGYGKDPGLLALADRLARKGRRKSFASCWVHRTLRGHEGPVLAAAISPDERHAFSGGADKTLRLWNLSTGQSLCVLEGHAGPVTSASVSPSGRQGLSASEDGTLRLWDLAAGRFVRSFEGHADRVYCAAFSPDGRRAVSGGEDGSLRVWDVETGRCLRVLNAHQGGVKGVCFTPEGLCALSAGDDNALCLWDLEEARRLRSYAGHEYSVFCASIAPNGRFFVSGSGDQSARIWDIASGHCLSTREEKAPVAFVHISSEGRFILSGTRGSTAVKLWDMDGERSGGELDGHSKPAACCAVSPSGGFALTGGEDALLQLWRLDWEYEFPDPGASAPGLRPHLEIFLELRRGKWGEKDWENLLSQLELRGYGWMRPEDIRRQLDALTQAYPSERTEWLRKRCGL